MDDFGNYILGSETEWATPEEMSALEHKCSIHPKEVFTYHVSWQWLFEGDAETDSYDTYLGNKNGEEAPGVKVSIGTYAEMDPPSEDPDIPVPTTPAGSSPDNADTKPQDAKPQVSKPENDNKDVEPPHSVDVNIDIGNKGDEATGGAYISIGAHAAVNPASMGHNPIKHLLSNESDCCCCWLLRLLLFIALQLIIWIWWLCRKIKKLKKAVKEFEKTMS